MPVARKVRVSILTVLLLGALGGFLPGPAVAHEGEIHLVDFAFEPKTISVAPGAQVNLPLVNNGNETHTLTLFDDKDGVPPSDFQALVEYNNTQGKIFEIRLPQGQEAWANFTAPTEPGNYPFVCMVPGHAALGMVGTLVVLAEGISPLTIGIIVAVVAIVVLVVVFFVLRSRR